MPPAILLVDDDDLFREVAADALTRAIPEAVVCTAANGKHAIELIESAMPSVLITDLQMPLLDGFGVLSFLARRKAAIPVVVMSAFLTANLEARAVAAGALHCIEKPVDLNLLITKVRALLDSKNTGHVVGVTPPGFVQLLQMEQQNVTLRLETADRCGLLHFTNGELTDAWDGATSGDAAVINIFRWRDVSMDVVAPRMSDRQTVSTPVTYLIIESARIADETAHANEAASSQPRHVQTAKSFMDFYIDPGPSFGARVNAPLNATAPRPASIRPSLASLVQSTTTRSTKVTGNYQMNTIPQTLDAVMAIDGAIGVALCDWTSGLNLGTLGGGVRINVEMAGALNCEVVRAKMNAMDALGIKGNIEDILITLEDQYHLIRPLRKAPSLFLYVAMDKGRSNLGLARMKLQQLENALEI